jgi:hypothetical protein
MDAVPADKPANRPTFVRTLTGILNLTRWR